MKRPLLIKIIPLCCFLLILPWMCQPIFARDFNKINSHSYLLDATFNSVPYFSDIHNKTNISSEGLPAPVYDSVSVEGAVWGVDENTDQVVINAGQKTVNVLDGRYKIYVPKGWSGWVVPQSTLGKHYFIPGQIEISTEAVIASDTCCLNFDAFPINPKLSILYDEIEICNEEILDLNTEELKPQVSGTYGKVTYKWTANPPVNQYTISDDHILAPEFFPNSTTVYTLEMANANTIVTDSFKLIVKPLPEIKSFSGDFTVCQEQAGLVYSVDEFSSTNNYLWELPLGGAIITNTETNIVVINWGSEPGVYPLLLTTIQNGCEALPYLGSVAVLKNAVAPAPTNVYRKSDDNFLYCDDENADEYAWGWFTLKNSELIGRPYYIPSSDNWYCRLPAGYSIDSDTNRYFVEIRNEGLECFSRTFYNAPVSVNEETFTDFLVFPNPTDNLINIRVPEDSKTTFIKIRIYDFTGNIVFNQSYNNIFSDNLKIDGTKFLAAGIYFISIQSGHEFHNTKLIVR